MMFATTKNVVAGAALLLLAGSFAAAYASEPFILMIPLAALAVAVFVRHPDLLFYTLLASIPWSIEHLLSNGFGTDLPDEPLMWLTSVVALALFIYQRKQPIRYHPILLLLALQMAWLAIAVSASTHPVLSLKFFAAKSWYLLAFVAAPLLLPNGKKLVKRGAVVLAASMLLATAVGLVRHAATGFSFATVNDALKPFFRNHVNYSALLVCVVPIAVAIFYGATARRLRAVIGCCVALLIAALYLSYARGAWLAGVAGLMGFALLKKGWLVKGYAAAVVVVGCAVGWLQHKDNYLRFAPDHDQTVFHQNFSEHLSATYAGRDVSTAERFYRWTAGAAMATDRPLTGFGPSTFYQAYKPYAVPLFRTWVSNNREQSTVHNYFLLLLIEQGLPGLALFLVLVGAMFWYAQRIYLRTDDAFWKPAVAVVAVILCMQCTVNFLSDLIETDKTGSVFYLCAAVLVMASRWNIEQKNKEYRMTK